MAPRTRRSKTIVVTDNSQLTNAENQVQLDSEEGTRGDIGNIQYPTVGTTTSTSKANTKRKSLLSSSDLYDIARNREKTYHSPR
jgi:hypothetical protein